MPQLEILKLSVESFHLQSQYLSTILLQTSGGLGNFFRNWANEIIIKTVEQEIGIKQIVLGSIMALILYAALTTNGSKRPPQPPKK